VKRISRVIFLLITSTTLAANTENVRSLIHTLDYISRDYRQAVSGRKVINPDEYNEMLEFSEALSRQAKELNLPESDSAARAIQDLKNLISEKGDAESVAEIANKLKKDIIIRYRFKTFPNRYPDIKNGKKIYREHCSRCHGENGYGNGPDGTMLTPAPKNFHEHSGMSAISAFTIFNTVRTGIEGTGMIANTQLTDDEVWDVSFYVLSLRYTQREKSVSTPVISLEEIATLSDHELVEKNWETHQIANLRTRIPEDANNVFIQRAIDLMRDALAAYKNADYRQAEQLTMSAYLEGIEPIETHLKSADEKLAENLEDKMTEIRSLINQQANPEDVEGAFQQAIALANKASSILEQNKFSSWMAFSLTLMILLREGIEAFWVIMVLLAIMNKANLRERKKFIHLGWASAIVIGILLWIASGKVIRSGMSHIELMEGGISLLAVGVMIYVAFWLHRKSKANEWKKYVEKLAAKTNGHGSVWGLAALSFFISFREVFESLLFLSALQIQSKNSQALAIGAGILCSIAIVLALAVITLKFSAKLPMQQLFKISAVTISVLAFILTGKGVHSFQEVGWITTHLVNIPSVEILGIYNTWETVLAQILMLFIIGFLNFITPKI
jgi:high-affinity iron transporter